MATLTSIDAKYRNGYEIGWRYSHRSSANLDYVDAHYGKPWMDQALYNAILDGYADGGADRDKWHMHECRAGLVKCEEHQW